MIGRWLHSDQFRIKLWLVDGQISIRLELKLGLAQIQLGLVEAQIRISLELGYGWFVIRLGLFYN